LGTIMEEGRRGGVWSASRARLATARHVPKVSSQGEPRLPSLAIPSPLHGRAGPLRPESMAGAPSGQNQRLTHDVKATLRGGSDCDPPDSAWRSAGPCRIGGQRPVPANATSCRSECLTVCISEVCPRDGLCGTWLGRWIGLGSPAHMLRANRDGGAGTGLCEPHRLAVRSRLWISCS